MASRRADGPRRSVSDGPADAGPAERHLRPAIYSIWLLVPATTGRRLALLIRRLAQRCGTAPFDPHITLLGGITLPRRRAVERATALACALRSFRVRLEGAGQTEVFFRCLYLRASGDGLRRARALALRIFADGARRRRFRPHLSLVYGRLPKAVRRQLAQEIEGTVALTSIVRRIALVRTSGDHRSWRVIAVRWSEAKRGEASAASRNRPPRARALRLRS